MKKINFLMAVCVCSLVFSMGAKAQEKSSGDYFVGTWKLVSEGTPEGDVKSTAVIERKDGKLVGTLKWDAAPEPQALKGIDEKENSITLHNMVKGMDVYFILDKKDEKNVTGTMMDMFDVTGVKEVK